jgi:hypothetical protein
MRMNWSAIFFCSARAIASQFSLIVYEHLTVAKVVPICVVLIHFLDVKVINKFRTHGRIQTCTRRIRSAMHYSVMLRGQEESRYTPPEQPIV